MHSISKVPGKFDFVENTFVQSSKKIEYDFDFQFNIDSAVNREAKYKCKKCDFQAKTKGGLKNHKRSNHQDKYKVLH